jgi:hypothetical protein
MKFKQTSAGVFKKDTAVDSREYLAQQKGKKGQYSMKPNSSPMLIPMKHGMINMGPLNKRPQVDLPDDSATSNVTKPMGKNKKRYKLNIS